MKNIFVYFLLNPDFMIFRLQKLFPLFFFFNNQDWSIINHFIFYLDVALCSWLVMTPHIWKMLLTWMEEWIHRKQTLLRYNYFLTEQDFELFDYISL